MNSEPKIPNYTHDRGTVAGLASGSFVDQPHSQLRPQGAASREMVKETTYTESLLNNAKGNTHRIRCINDRLSAVLDRLMAVHDAGENTKSTTSQPGALGGIANEVAEQSEALDRLESIVNTLETI